MYLQHLVGLFSHPHTEWDSIKTENYSMSHIYLMHLALLAAIPAVSLYFGMTQINTKTKFTYCLRYLMKKSHVYT